VASYDEVIPPGKAGTIRASIHTSNYRGPVVKSITVTSDDPAKSFVALNVSLEIVGSVNVLPMATVQMAPRLKGFSSPAKVLIRKDPTEKGTLDLGGLVASKPWLKLTSRKVTSDEPAEEGLPAAQPGDVVISLLVDAPPVGTHMESITFKTGLHREPEVTVPVMVTVRPAVYLQPKDLILNPPAGPASAATGQVLGTVREDLDPKSLAVVSDSPAFAARVEPSGERAFRIVVDWSGATPSAPTETSLHVRAGGESVDLPVRVNLARKEAAP